MTRSSTNELYTPYKDPDHEFRSSRRHFKTLSLDELRSPDLNLLSNKEYSEEEEEEEEMAETMEQYMSKTRTDYGSGVARPKINNKDQFELKGQFLKELRENTFSCSDNKDANEHIEKVLEIVTDMSKMYKKQSKTDKTKHGNGKSMRNQSRRQTPESLIRRRNLGEPSSLFDFEEVMSIPHNNMGPPLVGPPSPNNGPPPVVRPNGPAPRSMEELCQPSINGRGGPIALIPIQVTDFGLRHHMIQQVQNTCQFHGLPGDDANRHIDKFLEITQHMKQNGVSDDTLGLSLFPYSLTHHAIAWYDCLPRNSIRSFDDMMRKFLSKYFPPSMVTKLRNEITKFEQKPHESLFEAWERYKLSIDRCPNHNMLLVTQIDTFYNGLTLSHRDTINAAAGGTFMQKTPEECYELIENMTAHHNHWDTSATRDETSRNISSTTSTESPEVVRQLELMNKNFLNMMKQMQTVKSVDTKCETCGGPHSFTECPAVDGYTQEAAYATTGNHNSGGIKNEDAI
ncbi:reverse transcriptase domain-containing protein [Tanacetum coccineum]